MKTLVINLYSGPGSGKSTTAAMVFAKLKMAGVNCELAREWFKNAVWENRGESLIGDQLYIFAKHNRGFERLYGKVDVIVTDCPLLLSYYYSRDTNILNVINEMRTKADQVDIFLNRKKPYNPSGRFQTENEAKDMDGEIRDMLVSLNITFIEIDGDNTAADSVLSLIERLQPALQQ